MTTTLTKSQSGSLTLDSLRERRELVVTDARAAYARLLAIAVANPVLNEKDAAALEGVIDTLGLTLEELDSDIRAVRAVAAANASMICKDDEEKVAAELAASHDELKSYRNESAAKILALETKLRLTLQKRSDLSAANRAAINAIDAAMKSFPRAFGNWQPPAPATPPARLRSAI